MTTDTSVLPYSRLVSALQEADMRVLQMVLYHMTGDESWLRPPFTPLRDVQLIADEGAGYPEEVQRTLREAAAEILARPGIKPAITDPGDTKMTEMMSVCMGEPVPELYAPMMREQLGLAPRLAGVAPVAAPKTGSRPAIGPDGPQVLIVGAGQSGIVMGQTLDQLGVDFLIVDKQAEPGGTWTANRYPGCGVDTPNHAYSYSFTEYYPWTRFFSPREEILDYLKRCVDTLDLRSRMRLSTEVRATRWDEDRGLWIVDLLTGEGHEERMEVPIVISALGQFGAPVLPDIPGKDRFQGPLFHTSAWPETLDWKGKRIAIIGTGASAMQIVPAVADEVESLTIYQRTAQWARKVPRYHDAIGEGAKWLMQNVPFYQKWYRFTMLWRYGDGLLPTLRRDPEWERTDSVNEINDRHRRQMMRSLREDLNDDADLIARCTPDYPPYGKRILLENGWYEALQKPNVELVTTGIGEITETGVRDSDGTLREADILVFSTGFRVSQMASALNVTGKGGEALAERWSDDNPTAYLGIHVAGFPNFFVMLGPNTSFGHGGSAPFLSETQAHYISSCVSLVLNGDRPRLDVTRRAEDDYVRAVQDEHDQLIWTHPTLNTYYRNARGRIYSISPWPLVDYWHRMRGPDLDKFEGSAG